MSDQIPNVGDVVSVILDGKVTDVNANRITIAGAGTAIVNGTGVQVQIVATPPVVGETTTDYDNLPNGTVVGDANGLHDLVNVAGTWFDVNTGDRYAARDLSEARKIKVLPS